jgi:hypothetical protein
LENSKIKSNLNKNNSLIIKGTTMKKLYLLLVIQLTFISSLHAMVGVADDAARRAYEIQLLKRKLAADIGALNGIIKGEEQVTMQEYVAQNTSLATSLKLGIKEGTIQGAAGITGDIYLNAYKEIKALASSTDALLQEAEENVIKQKYAHSMIEIMALNEKIKNIAKTLAQTEEGKNNPELQEIIDKTAPRNIQLLVEIDKKINNKTTQLEKFSRVAIPTVATLAIATALVKMVASAAAA